MIVKQSDRDPVPLESKKKAGAAAERQMAFYLHRAFAADPNLFVLNDLRLVDPDQPDPGGRAGVCQIDHLVLHRWGAFIIESKSVTDEVSVRDDGAGGDEWTRRYRGRDHGFASPIQQARRQGEFLRAYLQRRREELLGKMPTGLRTFTKLVAGTDQRGFRSMPVQIIVAISDAGKIRRVGGWVEPDTPFQTFVSKADLVPDKIRAELGKHKASGRLLGETDGKYGVWAMKDEEALGVAEYLAARHEERSVPVPPPPPPTHITAHTPPHTPPPASAGPTKQSVGTAPSPTTPACKACGGRDLAAMSGRYGYFWRCRGCEANTAMPKACTACGASGKAGGVRVRKSGNLYRLVCEACGHEEQVWNEAGA